MSTQADAKKADLASDNWRDRSSKKRSKVRPYIIEWRYNGPMRGMARRWGAWMKWGAYETAQRRDYALLQKQKSGGHFEYRSIDQHSSAKNH